MSIVQHPRIMDLPAILLRVHDLDAHDHALNIF